MYPVIDYDKCTGSLACYLVCPSYVFTTRKRKGIKEAVVSHPEECIGCEHCLRSCPTKAIELVEK
ncbi:ferredoxin family protein [Methanosarcina sp. KYL-1]|uniref:4Fe-4S dicluster domain-containing protein n=1 Tax=Methanosarcina sp. KYL-1 TaxID=2602068 RepID=UPI0021012883|nr:ferredoxin family protein [Methanosarcina sp. KYL-1]